MSNFVGKRPNPLALAIQGAVKLFGKKQKTTGTEVIDKIKPGTTFTGTPKYTKEMIIARGDVQKKFGKINEGIKNETTQLRQTLQKMRGEKVTKSGISKGKDVTPGIYKPLKDKKKQDLAKGGRVGLKRGTGLMKKKSDVQKIKETFAPRVSRNKKASKFGMLSVKAGIDKNPNPTLADRIAGAKMKSKKRFV